MRRRQFIVIGMGRFGFSVAKCLYKSGYDVLAIDRDIEKIEEISSEVTHALALDATDEKALSSVNIEDYDTAIIAIGGSIQESLLATLLVKELGVNEIICKGQGELHGKLLKKIGASKVILPEKEMGLRLANNLKFQSLFDYVEISKGSSIAEFTAPKEWINKTIGDIDIRAKHDVTLIGIKKNCNSEMDVNINAGTIIKEHDLLILLGRDDKLSKLKSKFTFLKKED